MPADDDFDDEREEGRPRRRRQEADDYDDRPRRRRRRREPEMGATDFLIPTNVSGFSIASCYFGLVGCFLPFIGLVLGAIALPCGIIALRRRKRNPGSYGAVTGDMRAIIGIIFSSLALLYNIPLVILVILGNLK